MGKGHRYSVVGPMMGPGGGGAGRPGSTDGTPAENHDSRFVFVAPAASKWTSLAKHA